MREEKTLKKPKNNISPLLTIPKPLNSFSVVDANGDTFTHQHLLGKWTVLYFYPKDMTSGCTTEAREFQVALKRFATFHCHVIGVSKDSCSSHIKFAQKENLSFSLLSDTQGELCTLFDVWKEKSLYGKKYMGIERSTFLIHPEGKIFAQWRNVKVTGHVDNVLQFVKNHFTSPSTLSTSASL
jgi:peroxiredoxin Q/BCP